MQNHASYPAFLTLVALSFNFYEGLPRPLSRAGCCNWNLNLPDTSSILQFGGDIKIVTYESQKPPIMPEGSIFAPTLDFARRILNIQP